MRIKLDKFYQNVKGQRVQAGEYDASELPNGLAQYLVETEHATVIEADSKPIARQRADKTLTPDDVEALNPEVSVFDELKAEYEALAGEAPPWNIKLETLRARVEELRDED